MREGWKIKMLGDVCITTQGVQIQKSKQKSNLEEGFRRYLYISDFRHKKNLKYVEDIYPRKVVTENDLIVVNTGNSSGDVFRGIDGVLSNNLFKVSFDKTKISTNYIYYFLESDEFVSFQDEIKRGTANPHMGHKNFSLTPIPIPPIEEQKQIVAILDNAFSAIDQAKANIEKNIVNAKELFQSKLNAIFSQKGKGWEEKTLGEVCEMIKRGIAPKYDDNQGLTIINQKCIRDHKINLEKSRKHNLILKKVSPEKLIKIGDVLVNSTGTGTLGRVAQVRDEEHVGCTVDTHVTIVRPVPNLFFIDFFGYAMIKIEDEITKSGEGASGQTELQRKKLEELFIISYPTSHETQKRLVITLDALKIYTKNVINHYLIKINDIEELKKSILQKAFSGELTQKEVVV